MVLRLTVFSEQPELEKRWVDELRSSLSGVQEVYVEAKSEAMDFGQIVFVQATLPDLDRFLDGLDRSARAVFLIVGENEPAPPAFQDGRVDDVLVHPFRSLEILGKLKYYRQILMWDEVSRMNASFSELIEGLHEDLKLAERLQKGRLPLRFPDVRGFHVSSRYMAGMRSGGDYMDLAESRDGAQLSVVLTDSSSYGLSSAVTSVMMRIMVKLSFEESRSAHETVRRIYQELMLPLKEKDRLSMFYGIISRKDFVLRYLNFGNSCAFHARKGEGFQELLVQGGPLARGASFQSQGELHQQLAPEDRLVLLSSGFLEVVGGVAETKKLLDQFRNNDRADLLNELTFRVKGKFTDPDDMPARDCTALILDVDSKILRLTPGTK